MTTKTAIPPSRLNAFLAGLRGRRCVLFGTGATAREFLDRIPIPIDYAVDNNAETWGGNLRGIEVREPEVLADEDPERTVVIIASAAVDWISTQLEGYGFRFRRDVLVSPLILEEGTDDEPVDARLLVSCIGSNGGLFVLDTHERTAEKVFAGNCRGIIRLGDGFVVALDELGLVRLDANFAETARHDRPDKNLHGIALDDSGARLYVTETADDCIGIYDTVRLSRMGELRPADSGRGEDRQHINSLAWEDGQLIVSMFSINGVTEREIWSDGVVAALDAETGRVEQVIVRGLKQPHTVLLSGGRLYYCNSMECSVNEGDRLICQLAGYTRGLAKIGETFFIGQSEMRRLSRFADRFTNIAMDCGVHIWNADNKTSRFLPIPAQGIFDLLVL